MRAVIYARVSKDKRDRASVEQQEDEARLAAAALGWTVTEVFVDNDVSASRYAKKGRESHAALLEALRGGLVDVLILWESSRGDRKLTTWSGLLDLCRDLGIKIHVVNHQRTYDLLIPRDWKTLAEEGVNNAYASDETRQRLLRDVRANAVKGRPHGKLRYGYTRTYDERGRFISQDEKPEQGELIREAGRRVLAGESTYKVAQDFNARGLLAPAGGKWLPNQIKRILTEPAYIGQRVHQGVVIGPAVWPAILDEETYLACKATLEDPRRNNVRDRSLKYLLSGLAKCGECGGRMRVLKNRGYYAYSCFEKFCTSVRNTYLDDFVTALVHERLSRPDFLELLATPPAAEKADPLAEVRALKERLDGFYAASAAGEISPGGLAAIESRLLEEIKAAEGRAVATRVPGVLRRVVGGDIVGRWADLEIGTRREVVDLLMTITVNRTVRGSRFKPERVAIEWRSLS